jgi:hypothetical protein
VPVWHANADVDHDHGQQNPNYSVAIQQVAVDTIAQL